MPEPANPSQGRALRRPYRKKVLDALAATGFELAGEPLAGKESRFFSADFAYPSEFASAPGLRPHLRIEMTFEAPVLPPIERPIRSLIAQVQGHAPEVATFPCIDPVETAADKLSALAWRACVRDRNSEKDDPTIIRHLHDLAALDAHAAASPAFAALLTQAMVRDGARGRGRVPAEPAKRFALMLERLDTDPLWAEEYEEFVHKRVVRCAGRTDRVRDCAGGCQEADGDVPLGLHHSKVFCSTRRAGIVVLNLAQPAWSVHKTRRSNRAFDMNTRSP